MTETYISKNIEETHRLARDLFLKLPTMGTNVIALEGELGAGKTTFAQAFLQAAGATGPFTSPTFVIMKKYDLPGGDIAAIYHFDCYRVTGHDVMDIGWEEIVGDRKNIILVEWPERIKDLIPIDAIRIKIEILADHSRNFIISQK